MSTSTITAKGQLTLPKEIRDFLGVASGDRVEFTIEESGKVSVRRLGRSVMDLAGMLYRPGVPAVTLEEMDESIADFLAEDDERIKREWHDGRR